MAATSELRLDGYRQALQTHGVAVVGFDDIDEARHTNPGLTTIACDHELLTERAVDGQLSPCRRIGMTVRPQLHLLTIP